MNRSSPTTRRVLYMLGLIIAGEAVYALPFHLARFFRPTVLEVFSLTATELGAAQGVYGVVAMLAYFPGGPLADRYPARKLMAVSLWSTAAGGLYLTSMPDYQGSLLVWGFFGLSTILTFWAALIRATREWGGVDEQGRAYGLLDSGRGALAAGLASLGVMLFSFTFPEGYDAATFEEKQAALRTIIIGYTVVTALAGVFVWFAIRDGGDPRGTGPDPSLPPGSVSHIGAVFRMPAVWLQAVIIVCAYVGYKGFDNYSLYFTEAWELDPIEAGRVVTLGAWMRPVAALGAGLLGDRYTVTRMTLATFVLLLLTHLYFAVVTPVPGAVSVVLSNTLLSCAAIFGLRGLYYALFEEIRVPAVATGTAVGFVSVIGYTPDVFANYVVGRLIDASPGLAGHQHAFWFLAAFSAAGVVASVIVMRLVRAGRQAVPVDPALSG